LWGEKIDSRRPLTEANCDARYYRQFWVNAVRWLAAGKVGNTNRTVTLEVAQSVCHSGEKVMAAVRLLGAGRTETGDAEVTVSLAAENQPEHAVKVPFDPATRAYRLSVTPPASGDYCLTATAVVKNRKLGEDKKLLVCEDTDPEMERVRVNAELMAEVARASGGKNLDYAGTDGEAIKSLFGSAPAATVEMRRTPLWDRWVWLSLLLGLMSLEWGLRRKHGLA